MAVKLRGALLGSGNIALRGHAPQWSGDETLARDVEIVAFADLSAANREAAAKLFPNARGYERAEDLLGREALDFCDVCAPPFTHRPLVALAAARGVHVLCEKPIAPTLVDAEAIAEAVRAANIVFIPCHQYHHSPQWQTVARLLPRIGRIHLVDYVVHRTEANPGNANWSPSWRTDKSLAGGGILFDHGAHIFYQLCSVLGEPVTVQATVRTLRHAAYGVEDSAIVMLDYGDRLAEVRLTWAARTRSINFHFVGDAGELIGDDKRVVVRAETTEEVDFTEGMSGNSSHSAWYAPLMRDMVTRIRARDTRTDALDEALLVARIIDRAYQSSTEGRTLALAPTPAKHPEVGRAFNAVADAMSRVVESPTSAPERGVESALRTPWTVRAGGIALLAVATMWVGHGVDWITLRNSIAGLDPMWIVVAVVVNMAAVYAMAGRWAALLKPIAPRLSQFEAFKAMLMGFAVSTIVPARAGEIARAEWLARRTGLPRAVIFGSIVLDALVNAAGMFAGIALLPFVVNLPGWLHSGIWLALAVFGIAGVGVFLLRPRAEDAGAPQRSGEGFLARMRLGLAAIKNREALAQSFGMSLVAWLLEICVVLSVLRAFNMHVPLWTSLLVLMAVNLALVVPFAPPANLGSLEVGATLALMESGVTKEHALAFALVYHLLQVIPIGFAGLALASKTLFPDSAQAKARATSPGSVPS